LARDFETKEGSMKKIVGVTFFLALTMAAALPAKAALSIQSEVASSNPLSKTIAPLIRIYSDSSTAVSISGVVVSYFFHEPVLPVSFSAISVKVNGMSVPPSTVKAAVYRLNKSYTNRFVTTTHTNNVSQDANHVIELTVPSGATASSSAPYEIDVSVSAIDARTDPNTFSQAQDWSYISNTNWTPNQAITIEQAIGSASPLWGIFPYNDRSYMLRQAQANIQHVVIIMQENRSYDSYFGTFPNNNPTYVNTNGSVVPSYNGIANAPSQSGLGCDTTPTTYNLAASTVTTGTVDLPHYMDTAKVALGCSNPSNGRRDCTGASGKLTIANSLASIPFNGKNGVGCTHASQAQTLWHYEGSAGKPLFNYWTIAKTFLLQDAMFEPVPSWSPVSHLFMVSGWSANCAGGTTCDDSDGSQENYSGSGLPATFGWSEVTNFFRDPDPTKPDIVKWGYFVGENYNYNCGSCKMAPGVVASGCFKKAINGTDPIYDFWDPLPSFSDMSSNDKLNAARQPLPNFLNALASSTPSTAVPAVSWIVPGKQVSEHDGVCSDLKQGEAYVTMLIQQIMKSPIWQTTAVFLAWDDWGGYYDHARPPFDSSGQLLYGQRVPAMVISPWLGIGAWDHQTLSFDGYLKFIEDLFANGNRLQGDGRKDSDIRENEPVLGDILTEFDFDRTPSAPDPVVAGLNCQASQL
jgi:phospholipase C